MMADAYIGKNDKTAAMKSLEAYAKQGGRNPATLKKLATLQEESGDKKRRRSHAGAHQLYLPPGRGVASASRGAVSRPGKSRRCCPRIPGAAWRCKPLDQADSNYRLALAYKAAGKKDEARDAVINALEAAPGYKAAQRLLLELDGKD